MRQLSFLGPRQIEWQEVPAPRLESDDAAIVRATHVARCDLDLYIALGTVPFPPPFSLGHEMVAEVLDVGEAVRSVRPGDRVVVTFQLQCGGCDACRRGHTNACTEVPLGASYGLGRYGGVDFGGAFSDALRVPFADAMCLPLPEGVDPFAAVHCSDNAADGYRTVAPYLAEVPEAEVLVVGGLGQSVGLYAAQAACGLGAKRVVYTDFDEGRLALARSFGAEAVQVDYGEKIPVEEYFPITVDACTLPNGRNFAARATSACGVCTSVSNGVGADGDLPLLNMYRKGVRYEISRVHSRAVLEPLLDHVAAGQWDPAVLVDARHSFEDAPDALLEDAVKMVFERDGSL